MKGSRHGRDIEGREREERGRERESLCFQHSWSLEQLEVKAHAEWPLRRNLVSLNWLKETKKSLFGNPLSYTPKKDETLYLIIDPGKKKQVSICGVVNL